MGGVILLTGKGATAFFQSILTIILLTSIKRTRTLCVDVFLPFELEQKVFKYGFALPLKTRERLLGIKVSAICHQRNIGSFKYTHPKFERHILRTL